MAQIIKHRRGSLESISSATKRAGELLVVTGSAGITAANGDSILFVGIDGSTATPANKVLQGSSVPDLTGASYDTSVDGIPFYDSSAEKLYILNKGGNVEVKATANTGGTGIVSGSAQVKELLPSGTVSGSSQVVSILGELNAFSSSQEGKDSTLASYTASVDSDLTELFASASDHETRVDALEAFSSSLDGGFVNNAELAAATGALETTIDNLTTTDIAEGSNLYYTDARVKTKLNAETVISGSSQVDLAEVQGDTDDVAEGSSNLYYTDARVKTKLNAETVISGSSQVQIGSVTGFSSYSSSVAANDVELFATASDHETRIDAVEEAIGAGSNIDGRLTALETFSGSAEDDLTELFATASDHETRVDDLETFQSDIETAISVSGQNVVINGNLEVAGTQTIVDSTTVQIGDNIIELNGSGAANAGLLVKDATAPNTVSGSLLWDSTNDYWKAGAEGAESKLLVAGGDGVVSGSSQISADQTEGWAADVKVQLDANNVVSGSSQISADQTEGWAADVKTQLNSNTVISGSSQVNADSITNFDANVLDKMNAEGVISGSSQVTIGDTTGYSDFSSSIATAISASVAGAQWDNLNGKPAGIVSGSSQVVDYLDSEDVNLGGISGSSLDITGNAKIDGNIVIGGNITIGDASSDTISFGGEIASDILPSPSNTYDLGSATNKFAEVHATDFFGTINGVVNATNGVVSGSSQIVSILGPLNSFTSSINTTIKDKLDAETVVSGAAQIVDLLSNQAVDFGTGRVSADDFGMENGSSTFTGSFVGDGSGLTGLATNLSIVDGKSNSTDIDLLNESLEFLSGSATGIEVTVSNNTVTVSGVNASTSTKGVASFDADDFAVSSGNVAIKSGGVRADNLNSDVAGTGISLNGVDNSIEVDYGSTAGTAVEGDTALTVQGTANEIEISGGSITLGAGGTVTIGLPDDVTIGNDLDVTNDAQVGGDLTVVGNLFVQGTTTTVDSTTIQLGDNIIELNGSGAANGGLLVKDATAPNTVSGSLLWDSTNDFWKGGALGSEKEFARIDSSLSSNTVLKADASGLLVDTTITDDGTDVSITGDFTIGGLTANSFVVADGSKTLVSIAPSNAGDLIQWNGSSFVASNTVDGGTF